MQTRLCHEEAHTFYLFRNIRNIQEIKWKVELLSGYLARLTENANSQKISVINLKGRIHLQSHGLATVFKMRQYQNES